MRTLQLMDRSIIEYRTDPKAIVMLTYTLENQEEGTSVEHTEMLHNVYEGIFEKDFTLFYGEKMVCMIHEEKDGKKTQSGPFTLLPRTEMPEDNDMQSRYGMLNEMCRAFVQKKETEFKAQAEEYLKKESLAEHFCRSDKSGQRKERQVCWQNMAIFQWELISDGIILRLHFAVNLTVHR